MKIEIILLNVPSEETDSAYAAGARYSSKIGRWYVIEAIARYPSERYKIFRPWLTKEKLNWANELEFSTLILEQLRPDFDVYEQVTGVHFSGTKLTIDAVVKPKKIAGWKNPNAAIGLEFKDPYQQTSKSDRTHWVRQCIDYAHTSWGDFVRFCSLTPISEDGAEYHITFLADADPSTFIHESAHIMLDVMLRAEKGGRASPQLAEDLAQIRSFLNLTRDAKVEKREQEKFADAVEAHLLMGVQGASRNAVFNRVHCCMRDIYNDLTESHDECLSSVSADSALPNLRAVMTHIFQPLQHIQVDYGGNILNIDAESQRRVDLEACDDFEMGFY